MRGWIVAAALAAVVAVPGAAEQTTGRPAGNFRLLDQNGQAVQLSQFRGRPVVLEWNNPGCPYVRKHYGSGNMQRIQAQARAQGAVWLTINSGAPGKQGHMTAAETRAFLAQAKATPTHYLLDPNGVVGRGYGAKNTPQLFLIDAAGVLRYQGAIDDRPTSDAADIAGARNHIMTALSEVRAGRAVSVPETRPYGCTVKYADA